MSFYDYWKSLSVDEQQVFADKCGMSAYYISNQLVYGYKVPRLQNIKKMVDASNGKLTFDELCNFFKNKIKDV